MRTRHVIGVTAAFAMAAAAQGDLIATYGFTDLNGSYDGQTFHALSLGSLPTGGDVTDYTNPGLPSAEFDSGSLNQHNVANVEFHMDIINVAGTTADGTNGHFEITDQDGDVLMGDFEGIWDFRFGFGFFDGEITIASYVDNGGGFFDGTGVQGFDTPDGEYFGAISFMIQMPEWFYDVTGAPVTFDERSTQGDGMLVNIPSPAGLGVFGLAGIFASRRRR